MNDVKHKQSSSVEITCIFSLHVSTERFLSVAKSSYSFIHPCLTSYLYSSVGIWTNLRPDDGISHNCKIKIMGEVTNFMQICWWRFIVESWHWSHRLSSHLHLGLPSDLFPLRVTTATVYAFFFSPTRATCPAYLIPFFDHP
jgi:hypothetical protein